MNMVIETGSGVVHLRKRQEAGRLQGEGLGAILGDEVRD